MADLQELIKKGEEFYNQKDYFESRALFYEVCMDSEEPYPLYMLAFSYVGIVMTYLEEGDYDRVMYNCDEAIDSFEKLLTKPISDEMRRKSVNTLENVKTTKANVKQMKERLDQKLKEFSETDYTE